MPFGAERIGLGSVAEVDGVGRRRRRATEEAAKDGGCHDDVQQLVEPQSHFLVRSLVSLVKDDEVVLEARLELCRVPQAIY